MINIDMIEKMARRVNKGTDWALRACLCRYNHEPSASDEKNGHFGEQNLRCRREDHRSMAQGTTEMGIRPSRLRFSATHWNRTNLLMAPPTIVSGHGEVEHRSVFENLTHVL